MSDEGELEGQRGAPADGTEDGPAQAGAAPGAPATRTAWERSLFDGEHGDQGQGVPGYEPAMPSGPRTPPKPGIPSSGNLRLPDWMREEMQGGRGAEKPGAEQPGAEPGAGRAGEPPAGTAPAGGPPGPAGLDRLEEDEGRTRLMLFFGVGLLVVALIAAGAVYLLKRSGGGTDEGNAPAPGGQAATTTPSPGPPNVALPPTKALMRFRGHHGPAAGMFADRLSGIAYPLFGPPWQVPGPKSGLGRVGWSGQQVVVTERHGGRPAWYGQLLSGTLSAAQRNLYAGPGTERQAAAALAAQYDAQFYGFPHTVRHLASQPLSVGGHRGWLVGSYIGYHRPGIKATAEVVTVAVVDTGRAGPAILFMALPNTARALWPDINYVFASLRVVPR
ncbi:MAG TPA: hypothetical protein VF069_26325 [Streptosporangiaceae bacterium]